MSIVQMSFYGGIIIGIIMIVRAIFKNRLPGKTFPVLWMIAIVRLMVPFTISSPVSAYTLFEKYRPALSVCTLFEKYRPALNEKVEIVRNQWGAEANMQGIQNFLLAQPGQNTTQGYSLCQIIWFGGVLLCLGYFVYNYVKCSREFKTSLPVEDEYIRTWKRTHPLRRKLSVRQSDRISSPLTYGIFRPVILMPKSTNWKAENELRYVLEHEYVHIQRWDMILKILMIAALCLHWFNPLVWVMYILLNRDLELSCDETVIRRFGRGSRREYAALLINMAERENKAVSLYCSFGKTSMEERIYAILKKSETTRRSRLFAGILVMGIALAFATSADSVGGYENRVSQSEKKEDVQRILENEELVSENTSNGDKIDTYPIETSAETDILVLETELQQKLEKFETLQTENYSEVVKTDAEIRRDLGKISEYLAREE